MKQLGVKIPEPLHEKIMEAADKRGITKSEKVRNDLMQKYYD
jgi:hypothetical protein